MWLALEGARERMRRDGPILERWRANGSSQALAVVSPESACSSSCRAAASSCGAQMRSIAVKASAVAARSVRIQREGGNPFAQYHVPNAILRLKQGLGRLLRSTTDRGILAVLDNRISTKPYGRLFMESLPDYEVTDSVEKLVEFMDNKLPS